VSSTCSVCASLYRVVGIHCLARLAVLSRRGMSAFYVVTANEHSYSTRAPSEKAQCPAPRDGAGSRSA
jgi:hypothetical protein